MAVLADFHLSARVRSSDGRPVGTLHRVVVDQETFDPKAIVVKEDARFGGQLLAPGSWLLTDDLIVPIDAVAGATHDTVELTLTAAEVRRLPPYLAYHFRPPTAREAVGRDLTLIGGIGGPALAETANKPAGEIEIAQGENVMLGRTGRKLGRVRDVLVDGGELIGIVLRPQGLFEHDVVLPVRFLSRSDDAALFAELAEADLEHLAPFQPRS